MATKRGLADKNFSVQCNNNETTVNAPDEIPIQVTCTALSDCIGSTTIASNVPLLDPNTIPEAQESTTITSQMDGLSVPIQHRSGNMAVSASLTTQLVVAPEFETVHDSWEALDEALKIYGKNSYQLYVIRSTTSVKRRNIKIQESSGKGSLTPKVGTFKRARIELGMISSNHEMDLAGEKTLIPERYQWYSKSLKCTHGWKNRYRGTGKRGSGVVRSTSCPAKMCVTLQHRGSGPDDWKVVVTKHVRTHNHQLSKELYLYYTENRRIYDPDLLAAKPSIDFENANLSSFIDPAYQRSGLSKGIQQQVSSIYSVPDSSSTGVVIDSRTNMQRIPDSDNSFESQPRTTSAATNTPMPPLGTMILTPGTIPSTAMDGGGYCVPRVSVKVHTCWKTFHDYIAQYAFDTSQIYRTRSTVSVAARNAKILASIAAKTVDEGHDVASYVNYTTAAPKSRLIPDECKWFSKLLICTYGWKRRGRSNASQQCEQDDRPCPAMLLARMERNVNGNWRVIINRQVVEHNHRLGRQIDDPGATYHEPLGELAGMLSHEQPYDSTTVPPTSSADPSSLIELQTISTQSGVVDTQTDVDETQPSPLNQREIVVRVPRLQSIFSSWDDFHASLRIYSNATYQLYRTRTTSSVKGRNKKIAQMKSKSEEIDDKNDTDSDLDTPLDEVNATRKIPESWRWYSKTLTCTHGWKERHRGTGKRNAHGVRSTACPVKICATVQHLTPSTMLEKDAMSAASKEVTSESCWRVVVTKHIVDHNHNLSRELYQHYCENRRIYDPELLAIDTSNTSIVTTHKTGSSSLQKHDGMVTDADRPNIQSNESQLHPKSVLSMQLEAGLAEAVSQAHLLSLSGINQSTSFGMSGVPASLASASIAQQTVPSVVLLPYSSTISYLPTQAQTSQQGLLQQQHEVQQQHTQPAFMNAENIGQHSATVASNAINSANVVLFNNSGMTVTSTLPPSGSSVISRACRVHGSSVGTDDGTMGFTDNQATQCSCFRIAGGGNYVTIVPASEPMGSTDTLVNSDEDAKMFAETDGVWQPSSKLEIEKVTTESGATIWRVPRILRRYPTWDIFHKYLDTYSIATFQLYRVRTTYSVRSRNIRLRQLAASRGLVVREGGNDDASETEQEGDHGISRAHLVPEEYDWYSKTFLCTHGWKRRSRGRGQRLSHNVRATECPAKVCATLQRTDGSSNWSVVVTKHLAEHNHELSEALYQQYSEVRRVRDPAVLARAEHLWRTGATRRRVFEFLKEQSPNQLILMKDVHNLVQRWQTQERRPRLEGESETQSHVYVQQPGSKPMVSSPHDDTNTSWL